VQLATLQALARYWASDYDLGRVEARLNALPQFTTEIDGVDIHFLHVRSPHEHALPLIMTHGWPGSVIELLEASAPSPTRPPTAAPPRTPSTWCCRRYPATASPASRPRSAGTPTASRAPGRH
jgi:Epoxide hydrolase N terminus